jgi:hypothetical protein
MERSSLTALSAYQTGLAEKISLCAFFLPFCAWSLALLEKKEGHAQKRIFFAQNWDSCEVSGEFTLLKGKE